MSRRSIVRTAALTTAMTQILGPSDSRVALLFTPPTSTGQSYTLTTEGGAVLGAGLNLSPGAGPILLTEEAFGDAVKRAWYAAANAGITIGFLETVDV
jgi:hypothetical protein